MIVANMIKAAFSFNEKMGFEEPETTRQIFHDCIHAFLGLKDSDEEEQTIQEIEYLLDGMEYLEPEAQMYFNLLPLEFVKAWRLEFC